MATFAAVTRAHLLRTIEEHDALGEVTFLARHGFDEPREFVVLHEGVTYDAKAVLGVAHRHATGFQARADQFTAATAAKVLHGRGFTVRDVDGKDPFAAPVRSGPTRAARTSARPTSPAARKAEPAPPAICPRCFMALPATGVCDDCS